MLRRDRLATGAKRLVSPEMIVLAPARDIGPGDRSILTAGNLKRPGQTRIWQMPRGGSGSMRARGMRGNRSHRQHDGDYRKRGGISPEAAYVSERFPCQPASSSDRVKS